MSRLSIVVPFFNTESYLRDTLASIARQSYEDLEVIMVNDGSTDGSAAIAAGFARADSRFTLVNQPNGGLSNARNTGASHATGEFLNFIDGDDLLPRYAYELMVNSLRTTRSDMVAGGVLRYASTGASESPMHTAAFATTALRSHVTKRTALIRDWTAWNKMYRRAFYEEAGLSFPEGILYEDAPVSVRAHVLSSSTDVLAPPIYYWRMREVGALSITQRVSDPGFYLDRLTSMSMVSSFLDERHDTDLRAVYEATAIAHHFPLIIRSIGGVDAGLQQAFLDAARTYLARLAPGVMDQLSARLREQVGELAAGRLPGENTSGIAAKLRKATNGAAYARVNDVSWEGDELVVRGQADAGGSVSRLQPVSARVMWLRELKSRRVVRLSSRVVLRPSDPLGSDGHRAQFEVRLNPADLKRADGWHAGSWRYAVAFLNHHGLHRTALRVRGAGPVTMPVRQLDEMTRIVPTLKGGMLTLDLVRAPVVVSALQADGGVLTIKGRTHLKQRPESAVLRLGRVKGIYDHTTPVRLSGSGDFDVAINLDELADLLGPAEVAPVAGATDSWKMVLECTTGGKTAVHGISVGMTPGLIVPTTSAVASLHPDGDYDLALTLRPAMPVVTALAWEPDTILRVSGTGQIPDGSELILRSGQRQRRWPIEAGPDGWYAPITAMAAQSVGGAPPLPNGDWRVLICLRDEDGAPIVTDLPVNPAAITSVASKVTAGDRTFWLGGQGGDGAVLSAGEATVDEDAKRRAQTFLQTVHYPRVRSTEPLADVVCYSSFGGRAYAGSSRAVHEELVRRDANLRHVWVVQDDQIILPPTASPVRMSSQEHYEVLATARYVVFDGTLPAWFSRRDGQVVVQVWRSGPVRLMGLDGDDPRPGAVTMRERLTSDAGNWTYLVSPNAASTPYLSRALGYDGRILETGRPRTDALYSAPTAAERAAILERLGIPPGKRILLYAPTTRGDLVYGDGRERIDGRLDFEAVQEALGDEFAVLVRKHPDDRPPIPGAGDGQVWDVSAYSDITDLLAVSDVLITDYSSAMFDFALTGRPILFFTYDLAHYRDRFYFDFPATAPGPLLTTPAEVVASLRDLDEVVAKYQDRYEAFRARFCARDDGSASARVVDAVFDAAIAPPVPLQRLDDGLEAITY